MPTDHRVRLNDTVSMELLWIPPGAFLMGSRGEYPDEEPRHLVRITRPYYLGRVPVTQAQFAVWTSEAGVEHANRFPNRADHPAESLDWNQARAFCAWLNEARGTELPSGYMATLPSEAQWEWACRAGTETEYCTGDGEAALDSAGWFGEDYGTGSTHPVGVKAANGFGLQDMHGNVWEWCRDAYDADAYRKRVDGINDPEVLPADIGAENPDRVFRGGSWLGTAGDCRSACRYGGRPGNRGIILGFRVCLVPGPVPVDSKSGAPGDGARRDAEAESEGAEAAAAEALDLSTARFPPRNNGGAAES